MEHQLPPEGDWRTWVILGGRGAGKTRAGSEWIRQMVEGSRPKMPGRCARVALVGETLDQAREVMVFGESGILACAPPDRWSYFVLLDGTLEQIELAASGRNTLQYFQIGPAARPYSDYSYRKLSAAFAGNGLRPYAPVHLAQKWDGADLEFSWIRRARLDGASWDLAEIPLSETQERYQVKIFSGAQLLRLEEVHQAQWRYSAAMQALDGAQGLLELQVAQLAESFGPGLFRKFRFTI